MKNEILFKKPNNIIMKNFFTRIGILILFLALGTNQSFAQDEPCSASTVGLGMTSGTTAGMTETAATLAPNPSCSGFDDNTLCWDPWYTFTAPFADNYTFGLDNVTGGTGSTARFVVYSGATCSALAEIGCGSNDLATSDINLPLIAGQQVWVRVFDFSCDAAAKTFDLRIETSAGEILLDALTNGSTIPLSCGTKDTPLFNFRDSGGGTAGFANAPYANNENYTITFSAPAGCEVWIKEIGNTHVCPGKVGGTAPCNNSDGNDYLMVYDGTNLVRNVTGNGGSRLFGNYKTTSGSVTFDWSSGTTGVNGGWDFEIYCIPAPTINATVNVACGATVNFTDPGGAAGDYGNDAHEIWTFCPDAACTDQICVDMGTTDLEDRFDGLYVYDGPDASAPLHSYYQESTNSVMGTLRASPGNTSGCLTFMLVSDAGVDNTGWNASVGTCPAIGPNGEEECADATDISVSGSYQSNTFIATGDPFGSDPNVNIGGGACDPTQTGVSDITQLENTIWYKFTTIDATCSEPLFELSADNVSCYQTGNSSGAQFVLYETAGCLAAGTWDATRAYCADIIQGGTSINIPAGVILPNTTYYIMMDAFAGRQCDMDLIVTAQTDANNNGVCDLDDPDGGGPIDPCTVSTATIDGTLDPFKYQHVTEFPFAAPLAAAPGANNSDFIGESSACHIAYEANTFTNNWNNICSMGWGTADIQQFYVSWDNNYVNLLVQGPTAHNTGNLDRVDIFIAIDTDNNTAATTNAVSPWGKRVDFGGWDPEHVVAIANETYAELVSGGVSTATDTDNAVPTAAGTFESVVDFGQANTEIRIPWALLGGMPAAGGSTWNFAIYTTYNDAGFDAYDSAPGTGNTNPYEEIGDVPWDADHCGANVDPVTGLADPTCGYGESDDGLTSGNNFGDYRQPGSDNATNNNGTEADWDTIEEYFSVTNFGAADDDFDGDGVCDIDDIDDDNDGIPDTWELCGVGATDFSCLPNGTDPADDDDGDGIPNWEDEDACVGPPPFAAASCFADQDGDGLPNHLDLDADNDGIPDIIEAGGVDADNDGQVDYPTPGDPTSMTDADGDGLSDDPIVDTDDDGIADLPADTDTMNPTNDTNLPVDNTDGNGEPNYLDLDADDDGIPDLVESGGTDANNDGYVDDYDPVLDVWIGTANDDEDGWSNTYDGDTTNDGIIDNPGNELITDCNTCGDDDGDMDNAPNYLDLDSDDDDCFDTVEADIANNDGDEDGIVGTTGTTIVDPDGDGWSEIVDPEGDGGTVLANTDPTADAYTDEDVALNCGCEYDFDGDGVCDEDDIDDDNDGIPDTWELCGVGALDFSCLPSGTDPAADDDGDGVPNWEDVDSCLPPFAPAAFCYADQDGDGQPNHLDLDADNDGIPDIIEAGGVDADNDGQVDYPTPGDPTSMTDADEDGLSDDPIVDTDDDGIADLPADTDTMNDTNDTNLPVDNTDGNGLANYLDLDSDDDGIPDLVESGGMDTNDDGYVDDYDPVLEVWIGTANDDEDGWSNTYDGDTNNDGTIDNPGNELITDCNTCGDDDGDMDNAPNYLDLDSDDDGCFDTVEADIANNDGDDDGIVGTTGTAIVDTDRDGWSEIVDPGEGGTVLTNTDPTTDAYTDASVALNCAVVCEDPNITLSEDHFYTCGDGTDDDLVFLTDVTVTDSNPNTNSAQSITYHSALPPTMANQIMSPVQPTVTQTIYFVDTEDVDCYDAAPFTIFVDSEDPMITCPADTLIACGETVPPAAADLMEFLDLNPTCQSNVVLDFGDATIFDDFTNDIVNGSAGNELATITSDVFDADGALAANVDGVDDITFDFEIINAFDAYGGVVVDAQAGTTHDVKQAGTGIVGNIPLGNSSTNETSTGDVRGYCVEITFASHVQVYAEDFAAEFSSINTAGEAWETSAIQFLDVNGNPFNGNPIDAADYVGYYNSDPPTGIDCSAGIVPGTLPINGSAWDLAGPGVLTQQETITIDAQTDVCNPVAATSGSNNSPTYNANVDGGIAPGTRIGGVRYCVMLEDVAASLVDGDETTTATQFTSSLFEFQLASVCIGDPSVSDDNPSETLELTSVDVSDGMTNPETITRTYTVTDDCGKTATCEQIITVEFCPVDDIDEDDDGIPDTVENYPGDEDDDGIPDYEDPDFCATHFEGVNGWSCAADGLPDPDDDLDGDGIANFEDPDFPTCGMIDPLTGICDNFDQDGDGIPNHMDLDADNDGIPDVIESGGSDPDNDGIAGTGPPTDSDGDGLPDAADPDGSSPTNTGDENDTTYPVPDTDGDGNPDFLDLDSDDDGIPDIIEAGGNDANNDGMADDRFDCLQFAQPMICLLCIQDDFNDNGWSDLYDNGFPLIDECLTCDPTVDADGTGGPNHLDLDADGDGCWDTVEGSGVVDPDDNGYIGDQMGAAMPPFIIDPNGNGWSIIVDCDDNGIAFPYPAEGDPNVEIMDFLNDSYNTCNEILPLDLRAFEGIILDCEAKLTWITENEEGISHFEVLRSFNGVEFSSIGEVLAQGSTVGQYSYEFTDANITSRAYYQLRIVEDDGSIDNSSIIQLTSNCFEGVQIGNIYPNPATNEVTYEIHSVKDEEVVLSIVDMLGRILITENVQLVQGGNIQTMNITALAAGVYHIRVNFDGDQHTAGKFVKLH